MSKVDLKLDWCSYKAAEYAVKHWHYSRTMPSCKTVKIGVWENGKFIGAVIFNLGACQYIGRPYGLKMTEVCELVRVALDKHQSPVTKIISISLKMLKRHCPGTRLVVSYADSNEGHVGAIYQAGNWKYVGEHAFERGILLFGQLKHRRTIGSRYGKCGIAWLRKHIDPKAKVVMGGCKYKYLMPLDKEMRDKLSQLPDKPYPKKSRAGSISADAPGFQPGEGGSTPTPALQNI